MFKSIGKKINAFLNSGNDYPVLMALVAGIYPLLFYYSNNYPAINSATHLLVFTIASVIVPLIITLIGYAVFRAVPKLRPYISHLLFALLITIVVTLLSVFIVLELKKKMCLLVFFAAALISLKLHNYYKHLILVVCAMAIMPLCKCAVSLYEDITGSGWTQQPDAITAAKFKHKPNVYMIQPDGYTGKEMMQQPPYSYNDSSFYNWLGSNNFTVYKNFKSNYPASLTSNASMFAMKHHYFNDVVSPSIDMPHARAVIMDNDAVRTFKNNGYETFFIAQDEYFQQNRSKTGYDHTNISPDSIPLLTAGHKVVRNVDADLQAAIAVKTTAPKFIFIEKLLPHHVHFSAKANRIATERKEYLEKSKKSAEWLKTTIALINAKDPDALIIILSDHGGWVGMQDDNEFYTTTKPELINSTFRNMAAIQWGGVKPEEYDATLKSSVNVFRVLFACLSEDAAYLKNLEEDSSYNIRNDNAYFSAVYQLIDGNNKIVHKKHE